jgi:hypothetical protein
MFSVCLKMPVPISDPNFYGAVIDENKQPVSGATIKILVEGELENGHKDTEHDLLSDQSCFALRPD